MKDDFDKNSPISWDEKDGSTIIDWAKSRNLILVPNISLRCSWSGLITMEDPDSLESLTGGIVQWKIRRFKLCCHFDIAQTDFSSVFGAIANSRFIRVFSFGHLPVVQNRNRRVPMDVARQVLDFALSSARDGLLEFSCHGVIDLAQIATLLPETVDRQIAARHPLRRFVFISTSTSTLWDNTHPILPKLHALLQLVSNQLPYLHDVGVTNWGQCKDFFSTDELPSALDLLNNVLTQMDDNQVGMTLFEPEVVPTVPAGLWSIVLKKAANCRRETAELPWTRIFKVVRKMVQVGDVGRREASTS